MSNMFNKSRATLPRPKVCKSEPPVTAPIPLPNCAVRPNPAERDIISNDGYEVNVFEEGVLEGEEPTMDIVTEISTETNQTEPRNFVPWSGSFRLQAPNEEGSEIVTVTLTFDEGPVCVIKIPINYTES